MLRTGCSQESLPSSLLCLGSYLKAKSSQAALAAPREASLKAYLDGNLMPFESGVDCIAKPASNLRGDFLSFQKFYHLSFFFFFPKKSLLNAYSARCSAERYRFLVASRHRVWYHWREWPLVALPLAGAQEGNTEEPPVLSLATHSDMIFHL